MQVLRVAVGIITLVSCAPLRMYLINVLKVNESPLEGSSRELFVNVVQVFPTPPYGYVGGEGKECGRVCLASLEVLDDERNEIHSSSPAVMLKIISPCDMANISCYWPGGQDAYNMWPCPDAGEIQHCCSSLHYCLENKLCYDQVGLILYRGACTSKPWSNDACGSVCLLPPTAARGLSRFLDESGSVVDAWDCNGRDCSNNTFKLGPGYLQNTHRLRTELDWDGLPSSATPSIPLPFGVGAGVGLGVLFLAALLALLLVCQRLRAVRETLRQIQPHPPSFPKQPEPVCMSTNPYELSQRHINQVPSSAVWPRSPPVHELPELGDTADLNMRIQ